ncbi:MAG: ABC transporter permease [Microbacteriaceae bacterium]|nr:MAG: ABC transporter permease [Microbacteriaceae bacterium]
MRELAALVRMDRIQLMRNPTALVMILVVPFGLLLLQAYLIPGTRTPVDADGRTAIDHFAAIALLVAAMSVALTNYPASIAGYRETGMLRRLDATPAGAGRVLLSQWVVSVVCLVLAMGALCALAVWVIGVPAPENPGALVLVAALGAMSLMSLGSLIAAVAANVPIAYGSGALLFMAGLLFAGVWTPGPLMPQALRDVGSVIPPGAMTQGVFSAWFEGELPLMTVVVLIVWAIVPAAFAARLFRWR